MVEEIKKDIDFHYILEYAYSAILLLGPDKKVYYHNKTLQSLLKCKTENILNQSFDVFLHPDFHEICNERVHNVIYHDIDATEMEQRLISYTGEEINVEIKAVPYIYKEKRMALVYIKDITKQKKVEKLLKHREKLSSIGQISAGIAHEVRNPLTAVKGFLELLKEESAHHYYQIMEQELKKALNTLNNLLQVSKPDLHEEERVVINLCTELESVIFLFQEQLYDIKVEKRFRNSDITIKGKRNLLIKALFNLIKNAIEAVTKEDSIIIEHFYDGTTVCIKIEDTGIGMSNDNLNILGTPFFTTKGDGTGMGLTQVYTTIQDHNGEITVESKEGVGTTFIIHLPTDDNKNFI
ncbi:two-component system sensor histidine kinase NtrB [Bacillus solitudinis]|uniref:two-component system sensor histidine kinase NtrB n=1 Tax=Bacillus solitudinis TaxID=2014074 RepID=UPI000C232942|nr:ATP-binding protein [Bacillus solitudinis]